MTNAERILETLRTTPGALCDDCVSSITNISPRQQVNALAAKLLAIGQIARQNGLVCSRCGRIKKGSSFLNKDKEAVLPVHPTPYRIALSNPHPKNAAFQARQSGPVSLAGTAENTLERCPVTDRPWHWEGNVQIMLSRSLERQGWRIVRFADTESKETGTDLEVCKESRTILFEVKGYPTTVHDYGARRGEAKSTVPSSQARQWYSHALLKVLMLLDSNPDKEVALCFPDFRTYRGLIEKTRSSLLKLGVSVLLVTSEGEVNFYLGKKPT